MNQHTGQQRREEEPHVINSAAAGGQCHGPADYEGDWSDITDDSFGPLPPLATIPVVIMSPEKAREADELKAVIKWLRDSGTLDSSRLDYVEWQSDKGSKHAARLLAVLEES
jgi:hypothetical protein